MSKYNTIKLLGEIKEKAIEISIYDDIDSTNEASKRAKLKKDFNLIVSETQTSGKGRHGKKWLSSQSGNIYMSISTEKDTSLLPLSIISGVVCIKHIKRYIKSENIGIKWPNDIIFNFKKIGGILIEKEHFNQKVKTIIGIGINLKQDIKKSWWADLSEFNLKEKRNIIVSRITEDIINCIDGQHFDWINAWKKSCVHIGKNALNANDTENNIIGTFHDIDSQGNAIVMTRNGIKAYNSGEIKIEGIY